MECPMCKRDSLVEQQIEADLHAHRCRRCRGTWIGALEYWAWVQAQEETERGPLRAPRISLPVEETGQAKLCPACGHLLRRYQVWPNARFYLDRCGSCSGVWFDRDEWEYLEARGEERRVHEFFGELWQEGIREQEAREWLEQMYLERFGAADYARIQEIREWLWSHPQQGALTAYLTDRDPYRM